MLFIKLADALEVSVVLGPKNNTSEDVLKDFLFSHGFKEIAIAKSSASYK